jgi:hypothetical protein
VRNCRRRKRRHRQRHAVVRNVGMTLLTWHVPGKRQAWRQDIHSYRETESKRLEKLLSVKDAASALLVSSPAFSWLRSAFSTRGLKALATENQGRGQQLHDPIAQCTESLHYKANGCVRQHSGFLPWIIFSFQPGRPSSSVIGIQTNGT